MEFGRYHYDHRMAGHNQRNPPLRIPARDDPIVSVLDCQEELSSGYSYFRGNGIVEWDLGEMCDPPSPGTCSSDCKLFAKASAGSETGDLSIEEVRHYFESECGNGIQEIGEACDDAGESKDCDDDCTLVLCGDFVTNGQAGEFCDDGNNVNGDGCGSNCIAEAVIPDNSGFGPIIPCGNGIIQVDEECDDRVESRTCDSDCTRVACGDGVLNVVAGEGCDDGNDDNQDACLNECVSATCGDGFIQGGVETCDDGNIFDEDGCSSVCRIEVELMTKALPPEDAETDPGDNAYDDFITKIIAEDEDRETPTVDDELEEDAERDAEQDEEENLEDFETIIDDAILEAELEDRGDNPTPLEIMGGGGCSLIRS